VSLAAEFQTSSSSHKLMLRKLVPKPQIKINVTEFALSNTTFEISRILTLDTVYKMLYGTIKSALALKNLFLKYTC
jgi:hypothetical protein